MTHEFDHVALYHQGDDDLAALVADDIARDLDGGGAVLVCVDGDLRGALDERLGGDRRRLTMLDDDDRGCRPIDALDTLWQFATRQLQLGTPYVHCISQRHYDDSPADDEWYFFEAAVNDVMASLPIVATCLFDTSRLGARAIDCTRATHLGVRHGTTTQRMPAVDPQRFTAPAVDRPDLPADAVDEVTTSAAARSMLRAEAGDAPPDLLRSAMLVLSELVTNAILHGGGTAEVSLWRTDDGVVMEVGDHGPGLSDRFAGLRPPHLPSRGAGLWIARLESARLSLTPRTPHGTIATAVIAPWASGMRPPFGER